MILKQSRLPELLATIVFLIVLTEVPPLKMPLPFGPVFRAMVPLVRAMVSVPSR